MDTATLTTLLSDTLAASIASGIPGVVAAITVDGTTVFEGCAGVRQVGSDEPMTVDTGLTIHSMTKAITAAAAMQLVEQGRLSLDAPAGDVLADLRNLNVLVGFDEASEPILRPTERAVTLRQLLTHTSGFVYDMWSADFSRYLQQTGTPGLGTLRKDALRVPLLFEPGTRWDYGTGIDWAGLLVEEVAGTTLGQYCSEHLFGPLAMHDTGFEVAPHLAPRMATMHATMADGIVAIPPTAPEAPEFEMGGGGLHSTVRDYLRFANMILNGGELDGIRVLQATTVAEMSQNNIGPIDVGPLKSVAPFLTCDADLVPGTSAKWGLSFLMNTEATAQGRPAGSLAWAGLGNLYYWIDPVNRVCGMWAAQLFPFMTPPAVEGFANFERTFYDNLG